MQVIMVQVHTTETKPFGISGSRTPVLYQKKLSALSAIDDEFPSASEITQSLKEKYPWKKDIPRTFFASIPSYDSDGEWDYETEYLIEMTIVEVME